MKNTVTLRGAAAAGMNARVRIVSPTIAWPDDFRAASVRRFFHLALGCALASAAGPAGAALLAYQWNTGFNNGGIIPDQNPSGWVDTRTVTTSYPVIESVNVTLHLSGGFNGDLYAYLSHGNQIAVLMNRVGRTAENPFGYADAGFDITLSDLAGVTTDIHSYGGDGENPVTGTFQSDGRSADPDIVLDTDLRNQRLTGFQNLVPSGEWALYFSDLSGGAESTVTGWALEIEAVPEPVETAFAIFACVGGLAGIIAQCRRKPGAPIS